MRDFRLRAAVMLLVLFCAPVAPAQQSQPTAAVSESIAIRKTGGVPNTGSVPNVVRFSGSFRPANGMPAQPVESVTLSVYGDQVGGTALWQETQNVAVDGEGKYSALMGATQNDGVPLDLLSTGEPRWLGVQFNRPGEAEQPRVLMASVPYALKASDAETLGGKPASAYLLAPSAAASTSSGTLGNLAGNGVSSNSEMAAHGAAPLSTAVKPRTISGQQGYVPYFTDGSNDLGDSVIQQSGGFIGVGTIPGAGAGTTPSLDLRTQPFSQIGMAQTTDYLTFFASDQFGPAIYWNPGHDLRLGKGGTPLYNAFGFVEQMRIQSSTGNVGIGTMTPGSKLDVAGDINFSGVVRYQGSPVVQFPAGQNTAIGYTALANNTTGGENTATGYQALANNTSGFYNTAEGINALSLNTTGHDNVALGAFALHSNIAGMQNTASGNNALYASTTGSLNTASGYSALGNNTTGGNNTAVGFSALTGNTTGSGNTAIGYGAGASTTGGGNIAIGYSAASSVSGGNSNNIHIGSPGEAGDNLSIRIGTPGLQTSFFVAGVTGVNLGSDANAVPVVIDTVTGQLGVASSSVGGITGVTAGTDLTGGGTSGTVTLNLDTTKVPTLAGANAFTGSANIFTGSVGIGTATPGSKLDVNGNINFAGSVLYQGSPVLQFPPGTFGQNIALGLGVMASDTTGGDFNTGVGYQAMQKNTTGFNNTALGHMALNSNQTGSANTSAGHQALYNNTGSGNTAVGSQALLFNTTASGNTAVGSSALFMNTGTGNTATGSGALANTTSGSGSTAVGYAALGNSSATGTAANTAVGYEALQGSSNPDSNTGTANAAFGFQALQGNTSGYSNTASGFAALQVNTTGFQNTASGTGALSSNTGGSGNTATGVYALADSTTAGGNTAVGFSALQSNTTGNQNTAVGYQALQGSSTANANTGSTNAAFGYQALQGNARGGANAAFGYQALQGNTTGGSNTAVGYSALLSNTSGNVNTAIGEHALFNNTAGGNNIAIGTFSAYNVSSSNSNNIHIGTVGFSGDSGTIRIGASNLNDGYSQTSFIAAGIYGVDPTGVPVVINSGGQLGAPSSSRRYKEDIQNMGDASRGLMDLRPVIFRYKKAAQDGSKPLQYGLIAEEVAEVYPDLVVYKDGQPDAVQYQNVNAMLLNEVQRQQAEIGAQKEQLQRLEKQIDEQREQISAERQRNQSLQERLEKLETAVASTAVVSRVSGGH